MTSEDPQSETPFAREDVSALFLNLRTAIDACEVDDGTYALPLLQVVEQTLSGLVSQR